ncbi:prophage pi2 protein 25 [Lactococcus lactis subsp. lactis IO-1]|nr:prophage pi2 protein 25 [Lactococcus lactis subsp. lactis IO-1]
MKLQTISILFPPVEFSEFLAQYDIIRVTTKKYRKYFLSHPLEFGQFGHFYFGINYWSVCYNVDDQNKNRSILQYFARTWSVRAFCYN